MLAELPSIATIGDRKQCAFQQAADNECRPTPKTKTPTKKWAFNLRKTAEYLVAREGFELWVMRRQTMRVGRLVSIGSPRRLPSVQAPKPCDIQHVLDHLSISPCHSAVTIGSDQQPSLRPLGNSRRIYFDPTRVHVAASIPECTCRSRGVLRNSFVLPDPRGNRSRLMCTANAPRSQVGLRQARFPSSFGTVNANKALEICIAR